MTVKEHYNNHLGNFYRWYTGDFVKNKDAFKAFCIENKIVSAGSSNALDLGAGNGIQSIALAELGFHVTAIDFNLQLIDELTSKKNDYSINIVNDDIRNVRQYSDLQPDLIVCCGDTLTHLESTEEIRKLLVDSHDILIKGGKIILTFRDYSTELQDTQRFIPVKSDNNRVFTCFLEYFSDKVRVTDLLYELDDNKWVQKVSSYYKVRLSKDMVIEILKNCGFEIILNTVENRIIHIIAKKLINN